MSLNDIDAQLAELKARLGGLDSEASDDESGGGAREESRDNDPKRKSKKEKKSKKSKKERKEKKAKRARSSSSESASDGGEDSDSELVPIAPLPASCLPEHNAYAAKSVGKRRKQSKAGSPATATAAALPADTARLMPTTVARARFMKLDTKFPLWLTTPIEPAGGYGATICTHMSTGVLTIP